jgi:hypothetical protein
MKSKLNNLLKMTQQKNIEEALNEINFTKHSWESESLTQVLEVFQFEKDGSSLKE